MNLGSTPTKQDGPISLVDAQCLILSACHRLDVVRLGPVDAVGAVVAETQVSPIALPQFVNSAMDGYAVRSEDCQRTDTQLRVIGAVMAGESASTPVGKGESVRIMTGAPLPAGADSVCPLEMVQPGHHGVTIGPKVPAGCHVRQPGEDLGKGDTIVERGVVVGPIEAGLLSAVGLCVLTVVQRPRIGILSTGDELVVSGNQQAALGGRIHDANRAMLLGLVSESGLEPVDLGVVGDDEDQVISRLMSAADHCDAVVSTGGVSVGDRDVVRSCLTRMPTIVAHGLQVAIKPGKPQVFAVLEKSGMAIFGLPGNPVAAAVSFELFVRPALRLMAGHTQLVRPHVTAVAGQDMKRTSDGKLHLRPVAFTAGHPPVARCQSRQGSHILTSLRNADALGLLPDGNGIEAGEALTCMVLSFEGTCMALSDPMVSTLESSTVRGVG